jgi:hypothetical protein
LNNKFVPLFDQSRVLLAVFAAGWSQYDARRDSAVIPSNQRCLYLTMARGIALHLTNRHVPVAIQVHILKGRICG